MELNKLLANRLLRKLAAGDEVREDTGRRTDVYKRVHDGSSSVSTKQFAPTVEFPKKSNESLALLEGLSSRRKSICTEYQYAKGFTLLEILIVLVIIAIVSTVALYSLGDFGASRSARAAAEQFKAYTTVLQEQATLEASSFGLMIHQNIYTTLRLNAKGQWQACSETGFFKPRYFPAKIKAELKNSVQHSAKVPSIIINPAFDMTPFLLELGTQDNPQLIQLIGYENGEIKITGIYLN